MTDLRRAEFDDADLRRADLRGSRLDRAFLAGADLRGADLRGCSFGGSPDNTGGADLRGGSAACMGRARLAGCRLDGAAGSVTGPVDVGDESSHLVDGAELHRWLADRGATDLEIRWPGR